MKRQLVLLVAVATALLASPGNAAPTPAPGGSNQMKGTSAKYPATAFNGVVRLKPTYFGASRPTDKFASAPAAKQVWVFEGIVSNGTATTYIDDPTIVLADKDGITADNDYVDQLNESISLVQAAATRIRRVYVAPSDFVPDHILYSCRVTKCQALRILLPAQVPAPSAT
jgi:hypothetical protein